MDTLSNSIKNRAKTDRDKITGLVFNIMRFSTQDGPGLRTTVFLKGCPLNCQWCHNPESKSFNKEFVLKIDRCRGCGSCAVHCPEQAISMVDGSPSFPDSSCTLCAKCLDYCNSEARHFYGEEYTVRELFKEILKDQPFFEESGGGVTFSGGEPLAQPEFLLEMLKKCRAGEIKTAIDTSGNAPWSIFEQINDYVDLYLYDLKLMDDHRHKNFTGVSNSLILNNLKSLDATGKEIVIRMPVLAGITDDNENIHEIGDFVRNLEYTDKIVLLKYHPIATEKYRLLGQSYALSHVESPSEDRMKELSERLGSFGLNASVGE